jgi:hypothetical protein
MTDLEARQRRLANNQTLFRSINSHVVELNEHFEGFGQGSVFVCECANTDCTEQVELSQADYERIRDNPRWFFVAASDEHVFLEVDLVVERTPATTSSRRSRPARMSPTRPRPVRLYEALTPVLQAGCGASANSRAVGSSCAASCARSASSSPRMSCSCSQQYVLSVKVSQPVKPQLCNIGMTPS